MLPLQFSWLHPGEPVEINRFDARYDMQPDFHGTTP
jgi:hypothetical protein